MDINEPMINEEIRDREVRVVATDGTQRHCFDGYLLYDLSLIHI